MFFLFTTRKTPDLPYKQISLDLPIFFLSIVRYTHVFCEAHRPLGDDDFVHVHGIQTHTECCAARPAPPRLFTKFSATYKCFFDTVCSSHLLFHESDMRSLQTPNLSTTNRGGATLATHTDEVLHNVLLAHATTLVLPR